MTLLRDIQEAVVDSKSELSVVLRKCKILSARLRNEELGRWVDRELNGYDDRATLPDYRVVSVYSKGHFSGPAGSGLRNADIPLGCLPKEYREEIGKTRFTQPISAYEDLLRSPKGGNFQEPWPPELVATVGMDIYEYMNCMTAWKAIPRTAVVSLVEAVRNRTLGLVLDIEAVAPGAGDEEPSTQQLSEESVTRIFNTHIYGNVGNLAQDSERFTQSLVANIHRDDVDSLVNYLASVGIADPQLSALREAIRKDDPAQVKEQKELGSHVSRWLVRITEGIAKGVTPIIQGVNVELIAHAILLYYGLG